MNSLRTPSTIRPFDLWGQTKYPGAEVAGESNYFSHIRSLLPAQLREGTSEVFTVAQLMPEPQNRFDRNAIAVIIGGGKVGYLPKDVAPGYAPVLTQLVNEGWTPQVAARVYGYEYNDWDDSPRSKKTFVGSVRLALTEPHMLVPATLPPADPHAVLPTGRKLQVTGEEKHMEHLVPLLGQHGETWIHVTLHELVEQKARSTRTVIEVRVNGEPVGTMSPQMSAETLPIVRHLAERGVRAAARAVLKGNRVKADVSLDICRVNELSEEWLNSPPVAGGSRPAEAAISTIATAEPAVWRFNPAPGWPPCPPGWTPPQGWRPDPLWPPAPEGWPFWVRG